MFERHKGYKSVKKVDTEFVSKMGDAEYLAKCKTNIKSEELAFPKYIQLRKAVKDMAELPKKMDLKNWSPRLRTR